MSLTQSAGSQTGAPGGAVPRILTRGLGIALLATLALAACSLFVGVYDVLGAEDGAQMFSIVRIPRTVSLVLAGASMAMAGLVMQQLTQNRFVEPTTAGTTEWAGLGLLFVLAVMPSAPLLLKMIIAVLASFLGTMIFFLVLRGIKLRSAMIVPIVGIMLGAVVGAVSTFFALSTNLLQTLSVWFMGSFSASIQGQYEPVWAVALVMVGIFIVADRFTIAGLGEDVATGVGLDYRRVVLLGTGMIAATTGIITVVIGNLPFLGLIVPNIVSLWRGDHLRSNLPWVALLGAATVTFCDILGRLVIMPFEIPVGTILSILGAFVFVFLILRQRRRG
ncbi:ABC transporter permease [Arachnia propionica]|uniref:ABC transporter permease n=1 Tax=Arachnia propionica TaxID=1750 RepID=A0A3P1TDU9_9ACTN|nr:iron chelate uptake ABC transporter family permease subunit [Arachnia propionica]MDO5081865.1 iron chelate uptake ABC transporter family permease subunit [Arachnia propionica]RRD07285.1 ABC transporter permease [Arachnia propionica]